MIEMRKCYAVLFMFIIFSLVTGIQNTFADVEVLASNPALAVPDNAYDGTLPSMACDSVNLLGDGTDFVNGPVQVDIAIDHTWVGDLVFKLQTPAGTVTTLMSRPGLAEAADDGTGCCGDSDNLVSGSPVTFRNGGVTDAEQMGAAGGDVCSVDLLCDYFPNPGAGGGTNLADFDGENAVGLWTFCVGDAVAGDAGTLQSWTLTVNTDAGAAAVPTTVPTMNEWGMIIFMVLAGIASIYYMRRRRKTA
jgi:subtilisin-like proprotein convertase family protein